MGLPWVSGARGPLAFDCWGLVVHVYRWRLGIELPSFPDINAKDRALVSRTVAWEASQVHWTRLVKPEPFCVVVMSSNDSAHHVGFWIPLDGGLHIHCMDKRNTVAQDLLSLRAIGLNNVSYYRYDHNAA